MNYGKAGRVRTLAKRAASLALALVLLCGLMPALTPSAHAASWTQPYLDQLVSLGIMQGDASGDLGADKKITRAEFVALVNRAYGYTDVGGNPYTDVPDYSWYAEDISIANGAGYFMGTSPTTASPNRALTREEAIVLLGRNMRFQGGSGESLSFTDGRDIANWSRGMVEEASSMDIIQGYPDGSFGPQDEITRGQMACILVRALGTLIQDSGEHSLGSVYGNVTINTDGVKLRDTVIAGNLYLSGGLGLGAVELENVTVLGKIVVSGTGEAQEGENSVVLRNVTANGLEIDSLAGQYMSIHAEGLTNIANTVVRTSAFVQDVTEDGWGLQHIELDSERGAQLALAGNVKDVVNLTPGSSVAVAQGVVNKLTVDENAVGSTLNIDNSASVREVNLDIGTPVTGTGSVANMNINAPGSSVSMLPDTIVVRPGIDANVSGERMDSTLAAESSDDPRILSGYPYARNVASTSADVVFSTNKRGTLYWAVTALSDGSVGEEELMDAANHAGKLLRSGTMNVTASKTEMTTRITGLTMDGSYYVSALLVDNRGRRSPVKVAAFTTPDDTVPNFATGYPTTLLTTDEEDEQIIQALVMPTKDCQLYYALLPKGSTAPTGASLRAGAVTGNLGYGVMDVRKNTRHIIPRVNTAHLAEETEYDLFLWLNDADNGKSSAVKKLTVKTLDKTPPTIQHLTVTDVAATSVTLTFALDEPGTLYWAVVKRGMNFYDAAITNPDPPENVTAKIQIESGMNAFKKGSANVSKAGTDGKFTISGLEAQGAYDLYFVAKDRTGNYSVYTAAQIAGTDYPKPINTLDTIAPTVKQEFTHDSTEDPSNIQVYPDTSIRLVFSESVQGIRNVAGQQITSDFQKLYNDVVIARAGTDQDAIKRAEDLLAEALSAHIRLYYKPVSDQPTEVKVRNSSNESTIGDDWVIDFRKATVSVDDTGTGEMIITIPYSEKSEESGLNMESGATYFFELYGIADTSSAANRMTGKANIWGIKQQDINTIDAQIFFTRSKETGTDSVVFDMVFQAIPITASSVSDDTLWDLLFWSESTIEFELYAKDKNGTWERVGGEKAVGTIKPNPHATPMGISVTEQLISPGAENPAFRQLNRMPESRDYGIVITSLDGSKERDQWSSTVEIGLSAVAGDQNSLRELSAQGSLTKEDYQEEIDRGEGLREIGVPVTYKVTHTFRDKTAPTFVNSYPHFTAGDEGVVMDIALSRGNTYYYYVIAPLNKITTIYDGKRITTEAEWGKLPEEGYEIKENGDVETDPETNMPVIIKDTHVGAPTTNEIMNPKYAGDEYKTGNGKYAAGTPQISVEGLKPDTPYIAYFVLRGEAQNAASNVYAFRFKTEKISRPVLRVSLANPSATVTSVAPANEVPKNADVQYMMITVGQEGTPLRNKMESYWDDEAAESYGLTDTEIARYKGYTFIQAMQASYTQNGVSKGSIFDLFANSAAQDEVSGWFASASSDGTSIMKTGTMTLTSANKYASTVNCQKDMNANNPNMNYWFVAMGRSPMGSGYAFSAARNLFYPNTMPPQVITIATSVKENTDLKTDYNEARKQAYTGTVTITFDNALYYKNTDDQYLQVVDYEMTTDDKYISSAYVITSPGVTVSYQGDKDAVDKSCRSLTLEFTATDGKTITFSEKLSNNRGTTGAKALTITMNLVKIEGYYVPQFTIGKNAVGWGNPDIYPQP